MPTFEISKNALVRHIGKPIADDKLEDRIAMLGAVVDKKDGDKWMIEAFANRPDFLSEEGLARALKGFLSIETGLPKYSAKKSAYKASVDPSVAKVREHVVAAVVKGISVDENTLVSLMQMQEKLHSTHSRNRKLAAIGVHDLDKIEFPIKYTTVRGDFKFVPLGYDREMTITQILREHPKGRDYAHLLEGTDLYPIWIDSKKQVLALPPIINAAQTAVTEKTKNLFIDVTGLNRRVVEQALAIIVCQLADAGGEIYSVHFSDETTPDLRPRKVALDLDYCNKLLGLTVNKTQAKRLLGMMRHDFDGEDVLIAPYRTDILHPMDLVEDVAIAYGYENFKPELPNVSTIGGESRETILERKLAEALAGFGFLECNTYHLISSDMPKKMRQAVKLAKTKNPVNINYDALRADLLSGLMQTLAENKHHEYPQKIFDIGRIIKPDLAEEQWCAAAICDAKADFTVAKSALESFLLSVGLKPEFRPVKNASFLEGRAATIVVNGKEVGVVGEIHPEVLTNFGIELPVAAFELEVAKLGL